MASPAPRAPRSRASSLDALCLPPRGGDGRSRASHGSRGRTWLAVLVGLVVFFQFALLGLRPALGESARLGQVEERLLAAYQTELEQALRLECVLRAQADPVYLERERRLLALEGGPLNSR